jgi:heme-degrading monooxygenase HmoA
VIAMAAFNVVRFRVKSGREAEFIEAQRRFHPEFAGFKRFVMIKTGDRTYCAVGEWDSYHRASSLRGQR